MRGIGSTLGMDTATEARVFQNATVSGGGVATTPSITSGLDGAWEANGRLEQIEQTVERLAMKLGADGLGKDASAGGEPVPDGLNYQALALARALYRRADKLDYLLSRIQEVL